MYVCGRVKVQYLRLSNFTDLHKRGASQEASELFQVTVTVTSDGSELF